ncbi:MAG: sulfate ABC transporter substrate-binding protein [Verrucomicrobiota bacterium]
MNGSRWFICGLAGWLALGGTGCQPRGTPRNEAGHPLLLNASFDLGRELFAALNAGFKPWFHARTGQPIDVVNAHAGASKQARAVVDGLDADLLSLNTVSDVDFVARRGRLLPENWRTLHPDRSAPYSTVVLFLVREGNPRRIRDWDDLVQPGVTVTLPNPKTSGTGRNAYLSAWGHALRKSGGDEARARAFVAQLFAHAPVLDTGGRGATITFVQRRMGDVLITLEAELASIRHEYPQARFETVVPSASLDVEMPVAVVERIARKHQLLDAARAYVEYLYTPEAQEIIARLHFRPRHPEVLARHRSEFPPVSLIDFDRDLGGWEALMQQHFAEGGFFDQIQQNQR